MPIADVQRSLENLKLERDAITLYDRARLDREGRAASLRVPDHRAATSGATRRSGPTGCASRAPIVPPPGRAARLRVRFIIVLARLFGTRAVSDLVQALEGDEEDAYSAQSSPEVDVDRGRRAGARRDLEAPRTRASRRRGPPAGAPPAPAEVAAPRVRRPPRRRLPRRWHGVRASADRAPTTVARQSPDEIAQRERWHRAGQSGTLRAVIFGVSDGLVSNLSLVMGVAGAPRATRGSSCWPASPGFSPARSAWPPASTSRCSRSASSTNGRSRWSGRSWRRCRKRRRPSWRRVYRSKGFTRGRGGARRASDLPRPETALDTLVREELGLDPDQLGSPWGAAGGSFVAFAIGAVVPVLPYLFGGGELGVRREPRPQPGRPVRGRGRRQPLDRSRPALLRRPARSRSVLPPPAVTYLVGRVIGVSVS